jgi:hypothetical protein
VKSLEDFSWKCTYDVVSGVSGNSSSFYGYAAEPAILKLCSQSGSFHGSGLGYASVNGTGRHENPES